MKSAEMKSVKKMLTNVLHAY